MIRPVMPLLCTDPFHCLKVEMSTSVWTNRQECPCCVNQSWCQRKGSRPSRSARLIHQAFLELAWLELANLSLWNSSQLFWTSLRPLLLPPLAVANLWHRSSPQVESYEVLLHQSFKTCLTISFTTCFCLYTHAADPCWKTSEEKVSSVVSTPFPRNTPWIWDLLTPTRNTCGSLRALSLLESFRFFHPPCPVDRSWFDLFMFEPENGFIRGEIEATNERQEKYDISIDIW